MTGLWGMGACGHLYGHIHLGTPAALTLVNADQYYKIPGTFFVKDAGEFETTAAGVLTFKGKTGSVFILVGVSDVKVGKACRTTYGLYTNGALVPGAETPHTFASTSKIENISIASIVALSNGDELEVYAKSDTVGTILTPDTLSVVLFGARW